MTELNREEYWTWAHSDLLSNGERGVIAEYIVGTATDSLGSERVEWDAWDLTTPDGVKIEVKASGYVQSWNQSKPSTLRFSISKAKGWNSKSDTYAEAIQRNADVYVFCLHMEKDKTTANPLDTSQWEFIVLPTTLLDERLGSQKSVGLATLLAIGGTKVSYANLSEAVHAGRT